MIQIAFKRPESLKTTLEMVGFGGQMDAAAINWTLPCPSII
jgi:hypothetical protein